MDQAKRYLLRQKQPRRAIGEDGGITNGAGYGHDHRERQLCGSFGTVEIAAPRAWIGSADGSEREWKSGTLPRYTLMTKQSEALIAGTYLAGANVRYVRRTLAALAKRTISMDTGDHCRRGCHVFGRGAGRRYGSVVTIT